MDEHIPKASEVRAPYGCSPQAIGKVRHRFFAYAPSDALKGTICVASAAYGDAHPDGDCRRLCKPYEVAQHVSYSPPGAPRVGVPLVGREPLNTISYLAARITQGCT